MGLREAQPEPYGVQACAGSDEVTRRAPFLTRFVISDRYISQMRSRTSQTETAVLGALSVEPMTGYAVRQAIRDVLGHFWSESFGQIYPTLATLEAQGHVSRRGSKRPGASTFEITGSGSVRLRELLDQPIQATPPRNGLMLRMFFGRHLGIEACKALVIESRDAAIDQLEAYERIAQELKSDPDNAEDRPYWLLTVAAGRHSARAIIDWADEALAALGDLQAGAKRHAP